MNNDKHDVLHEFDTVICDLRCMVEDKLDQYGTSRYGGHSDAFNYWMCFSDIHRKILRLEALTSLACSVSANSKDIERAREKLIDDYKDIANYAIMAVQVLKKIGEEDGRAK